MERKVKQVRMEFQDPLESKESQVCHKLSSVCIFLGYNYFSLIGLYFPLQDFQVLVVLVLLGSQVSRVSLRCFPLFIVNVFVVCVHFFLLLPLKA